MRRDLSCDLKYARLLSKSRQWGMCFSSGEKDLFSNAGVCLIKAFNGRLCCLQNSPNRLLSTNVTSTKLAKTCFPRPEEELPCRASCSCGDVFFSSSVPPSSSCSLDSDSASLDPLWRTKKASINGSSRFRSGFGGVVCTLDASDPLTLELSPRSWDGATPVDRILWAGVAKTSVSCRRASVRSRETQRSSRRASCRKTSIFSSLGEALAASLKTSARVRTNRSRRVSMVEGSAEPGSHFTRSASMLVTK
mmetsp:Transcript_82739/g.198544  ORF Transcript_82739/g.198544 Transcript_82739/m.198544 type:complete len:250 (-) Transcript_82739:1475-2224(-)